MGQKIPEHLDDPIDNILYRFCDGLSPSFKATGHTPNLITTYSLLTGILSCYFLYTGRIELFVALYILSYFFDCFDGYFARRYKMTSKFGDIYDHAKDTVVAILLLVVVFLRYRVTFPNLFIMAILFILFTVHMGCQQKYYKQHKNKDENKDEKKDENETIDAYEVMCHDPKYLKYTRFFGPGMLTLFTIAMITWIWYKNE
jgi:phosphatidylserine synthase